MVALKQAAYDKYLTSIQYICSETLATFVNIIMSTCINDDNCSNIDDLPALIEDDGQFYGVWHLPIVNIAPPQILFNNALAVDVD